MSFLDILVENKKGTYLIIRGHAGMFSSEFKKDKNIRWKIRFDDPNVTPIFVIDEKQLEHAVQYKRDKKIKDLGI